jgi:hypothetical protein
MKVRELMEWKDPPLSPRNRIACPNTGGDADRLVEIDTLYESCDATLNSDKAAHEAFRLALRQRGNAHAQVTKAFIPFVAKVAKTLDGAEHNEMPTCPKVQDSHSHMLVAYAVACDWIRQAKAQVLIDHQQAQPGQKGAS